MIYVALACSIAALISGLVAIGSGRDWHFTTKDIFQGRENAVAYVWVTCSTAFSIAHSAVIAFWMVIGGPELVGQAHTNMWMSFHTGMAFLFLSAHILIKRKLKSERGAEPSFLWGN